MSNYAQGIYEMKNPEKYIGNHKPKYRSGWELNMMMFFDNNKNVIKWASESIAIPYMNPLKGKRANYIPDFFVVYVNKHGDQLAEVIEVKPKSQTSITEAKSKYDQLHAIVNHAKWAAATQYCKRNGFSFRIITEQQLFHNGTRK